MNRRDAIKGLAGIATLLTSGVALAAPELEGVVPESPVLVTFTLALESYTTSKMIDQVDNLIDGMLGKTVSYRPAGGPMTLCSKALCPDLSRPVTVVFDPHTDNKSEITLDAAEFFKRRGQLVDRALQLHAAQTAARFIEVTVPPELATRQLQRDYSRRIRENVEVVQIRIFMLPKSAFVDTAIA